MPSILHSPFPRPFFAVSPQSDDAGRSDPARDQASATSAIKILLVEDEVFVAMDAEAILTAAGYEIVGNAVSGDEAVAKVASLAPDLVLMDIRLIGERDGIDAAHEIKRSFGTPIIFVTANTDPITQARAMQAQPVAIVPKPFTPDTLRAGVAAFRKA
jgi:two-component system, response regulator PdtaR